MASAGTTTCAPVIWTTLSSRTTSLPEKANRSSRRAAHNKAPEYTLKGAVNFSKINREPLNLKTEVEREVAPKDLRQQGDGNKRDGQTSPARDHRSVVG